VAEQSEGEERIRGPQQNRSRPVNIQVEDLAGESDSGAESNGAYGVERDGENFKSHRRGRQLRREIS
jgi:hypothetical protein